MWVFLQIIPSLIVYFSEAVRCHNDLALTTDDAIYNPISSWLRHAPERIARLQQKKDQFNNC